MKMRCSPLHCFHYREIAHKLELVKITIWEACSGLSPLRWPEKRFFVFGGDIWLNNMPLGGISWGRAMVWDWLSPERERWIIHQFSQAFGTALENRASKSKAGNEHGTINADVKHVMWSTGKTKKITSLETCKQCHNKLVTVKISLLKIIINNLWL